MPIARTAFNTKDHKIRLLQQVWGLWKMYGRPNEPSQQKVIHKRIGMVLQVAMEMRHLVLFCRLPALWFPALSHQEVSLYVWSKPSYNSARGHVKIISALDDMRCTLLRSLSSFSRRWR